MYFSKLNINNGSINSWKDNKTFEIFVKFEKNLKEQKEFWFLFSPSNFPDQGGKKELLKWIQSSDNLKKTSKNLWKGNSEKTLEKK